MLYLCKVRDDGSQEAWQECAAWHRTLQGRRARNSSSLSVKSAALMLTTVIGFIQMSSAQNGAVAGTFPGFSGSSLIL